MATVERLEPPAGLRLWWLAARPRTLPLAVAPVLVGTAFAAAHGTARALPALAALAGALLLQIGANFANDLFDAHRGADGPGRIGPARATSEGWVTPTQMAVATALAFAAAALVGCYLVAVGGWPIALLGIVSILAGLAYTGGPAPLGYHGLGDVAVFLFFGIAAVCGTYWVQALSLPGETIAAAVPSGALATAVLVVNNLRDTDTDRVAGKRTLAVRFGRGAGRLEYGTLLAAAFLVPLALGHWLPLLAVPEAIRLARVVSTREDGPTLNAALAGTARLGLVVSGLFAASVLLGAA